MWVKLLTAAGVVITIAGIVFGIWIQFNHTFGAPSGADVTFRLEFAILSIPAVGIGVLVIAAARILASLAQPQAQSDSN